MLKINHTRKSNVSLKMFIAEFGEDFPKNVKERLMDLEVRCFLTRKKNTYVFDLKHVEHLQYELAVGQAEASAPRSKEYAYGQFVVHEGRLYFSGSCLENKDIMQSPMVSIIYNALDSEEIAFEDGIKIKRLDENNIDYVVDSISSSCPQVSQSYIDIVQEMMALSNNR